MIYSIKSRDRIYAKGYGFLSFTQHIKTKQNQEQIPSKLFQKERIKNSSRSNW